MSRLTTGSRMRAVVALAAAAMLTLGACGSTTEGSASASNLRGTDQATDVETPTDDIDSGDQDTDSDDADDQPTDTDPGDTDPTDSDEEPPVSPTDSDDDNGDAPVGSLDAVSTAWFTELCTVAPAFDDMFGAIMGAAMLGMDTEQEPSSAELEEFRDTVADSFENLGDAMESTAKRLATMPPPSVGGGADAAANVVENFGKAGPALAAIAEQLRTVDTSSADAFMAEFGEVMESVDDMDDIADIDSDIDVFGDDVRDAVAELPGCKDSVLFGDTF